MLTGSFSRDYLPFLQLHWDTADYWFLWPHRVSVGHQLRQVSQPVIFHGAFISFLNDQCVRRHCSFRKERKAWNANWNGGGYTSQKSWQAKKRGFGYPVLNLWNDFEKFCILYFINTHSNFWKCLKLH